MNTYSQGDEQAHILGALGSIENGRFLDIGAWHPSQFSNTRALYERGWSGICIEPSPGPLKNLVAEYGSRDRVTVIGAAVGVEPGLLEMHITDDAVSTSDELNAQAWKASGGFYGKMLVPVITLQSIFERFGGNFDFISIDTEGTSADLLHDLVRIGVSPLCICVEIDRRGDEISELLTRANYSIVRNNGTNIVAKLRVGEHLEVKR